MGRQSQPGVAGMIAATTPPARDRHVSIVKRHRRPSLVHKSRPLHDSHRIREWPSVHADFNDSTLDRQMNSGDLPRDSRKKHGPRRPGGRGSSASVMPGAAQRNVGRPSRPAGCIFSTACTVSRVFDRRGPFGSPARRIRSPAWSPRPLDACILAAWLHSRGAFPDTGFRYNPPQIDAPATFAGPDPWTTVPSIFFATF